MVKTIPPVSLIINNWQLFFWSIKRIKVAALISIRATCCDFLCGDVSDMFTLRQIRLKTQLNKQGVVCSGSSVLVGTFLHVFSLLSITVMSQSGFMNKRMMNVLNVKRVTQKRHCHEEVDLLTNFTSEF